MSSLAARQASNASFLRSLPYMPVAIFVGGTSGIGQGMAEAFATHTQGNAHIVIVGRNKAAAEEIISKFPKPTSPDAKHEFVQCDATLMKNVEKTTSELLGRIPRLDYLVMSPGYTTLKDRDESIEGIDRKLAVHYYARWKFVDGLLPALQKAKEEGEDVKVFSVLGAGYGGKVDVEDFGLKKTFTKTRLALVAPTYNDLMMEEYSSRNPTIPFIHTRPGAVDTGYLSNSESSLIRLTSKTIWPILRPLLRPLFFTKEEAGENMLHGMLTTTKEPRAWRLGPYGEDIEEKSYYGTPEERKALWEHTAEEVKRALS